MTNGQAAHNDFRSRMMTELARDKKKSAVLAVLLMVALFVGVRMLKSKSTPETVEAAPSSIAADEPSLFISAASASDDSQSERERDLYIRQIDHEITRDLFGFRPELYQPVKQPEPAQKDAHSPDKPPQVPVGKSLEEIVQSEASGFVLQSTIVSASPKAVINEQICGLGDVIDGFSVIEIMPGACLLEKEGVQVRLQIEH
jgi:hypothetical protein